MRALSKVIVLTIVGTAGCGDGGAPATEGRGEAAAERLRSTAAPAGSPSLAPSEPTAAGVALDTQAAEVAATAAPGRIYRAAYEQARREIDADNAHDRLQALERQIDEERQRLP